MLHQFLRVAAASPLLQIANPAYNVEQHRETLRQADAQGVHLLVFPELSLTGYTCADLFAQQSLLRASLDALAAFCDGNTCETLCLVGLPFVVDDAVFNVAAVVQGQRILGIVPKSYLPSYKEFYEARWFAPSTIARARSVRLIGQEVPFGTDLLFVSRQSDVLVVGVEICEDLWVPIPPSSRQALAGATVLANLSASNETIGKAAYRRQLVAGQSGRCLAAYIYASCGVHESTTDVVFGGHCLIAENGSLLAETKRFQRDAQLLIADVDLDRLQVDRLRMNSFSAAHLDGQSPVYRRIHFDHRGQQPLPLRRTVESHPFVPTGKELAERCEDIFATQMAGLARRLEQLGKPAVAIGISGGLDSTLALLVTVKTFNLLGVPTAKITGLTMPGFGTTGRTRDNAHALMRQLGVSVREIDIRAMCLAELRALGHSPFGIDIARVGDTGHWESAADIEQLTDQLRRLPADRRSDLVFENVQARMRTTLLMNSGFVIGTGDVSELALGWCTYNADHMSMYNPNASIPKTLVKFLVQWAAHHQFDGPVRSVLLDVVDTVISPELLPLDEKGQILQSTETSIGPYELHDFFLYHFVRFGTTPAKMLFLASQATFSKCYDHEELRHWLGVFLRRFFASQYKRSCLPDGPKVGSISLSPRGDWRMPTDAVAVAWQKDLFDR